MAKYRIYKSGGQQMNPTAMWFAQMGAQQPSQEEMMMMQQQQAQQQGPPQGEQQQMSPEDQVMEIAQALQQVQQQNGNLQEIIAQMLQGEVAREIIIQALIQIGAPQQDAEQLVMATEQQVQQMMAQQQGQQRQPSEEEMMAMAQQQAMAQQAPQQAMSTGGVSKKGYINKRLKIAREGRSMDSEAAIGSATNFAAVAQPSKNILLNYNADNIERSQAEMDYNNMMSMDQNAPLEQARYGRARARRQQRRDNRHNSQLDRTIRKAYGDIAFPAGVAPMMMPGSPMMGTPGVFDMEVDRGGLFNRIKKVKMHMENTGAGNMPVNFAQGMFMNGLYNPMSMMNSGDFMYGITYPGTRENSSSNVTGNDKYITIPYPDNGGGDPFTPETDNNKKETEVTANTEPEGGCGEGMKWDPLVMGENDKPGACVEDKEVTAGDCTGGRKWNPVSKECECTDAKKPFWNSVSKQCVGMEGPEVVTSNLMRNILFGTALAGIPIYANREKIAKYIVNRGDKVTKKTVEQAIKEISDKGLEGYFSKVGGDAMEPLMGKDGQLLMGFFDDIQTVEGPQDLRGLPGQGVVDDAAKAAGSTPSGPMLDYDPKKVRPKVTVPNLNNKQKKELKKFLHQNKNNVDALIEQAKKLNINLGAPKAGAKKFGAKWVSDMIKKGTKLVGKYRQEGGEIDEMNPMYGNPDLYRFTGGGQGVDYFGDGGYYEDGGASDPPRYMVMTLMSQPPKFQVVDQNMRRYGTYTTLEEANARIVQLGGDPNRSIDPGFEMKSLPNYPRRDTTGDAKKYNLRPGEVLFENGGYYGNGGSTNDFEIMGQPAYKNVYDPYMPYANNGMVVDSSYQEEPSLDGSLQQGQEMYMSPQQVAQFMAEGRSSRIFRLN